MIAKFSALLVIVALAESAVTCAADDHDDHLKEATKSALERLELLCDELAAANAIHETLNGQQADESNVKSAVVEYLSQLIGGPAKDRYASDYHGFLVLCIDEVFMPCSSASAALRLVLSELKEQGYNFEDGDDYDSAQVQVLAGANAELAKLVGSLQTCKVIAETRNICYNSHKLLLDQLILE